MVIRRYLEKYVREDLKTKMVLIGGPRQVGKTSLALQFLHPSVKSNPAYMNWDISSSREKIKRGELPSDQKLLAFDELHKYGAWRTLLKGFYDEFVPEKNCIVTGSARLDYYRRGGDSLVGRYFYYRLHPLSLGELSGKGLSDLLEFGGFPEPFSRSNKDFLRRWQKTRVERLVREDLRDLEHVRELNLIELLVDALPSRVGAPLSVKSLREDLQVSHESVERWLKILENLYLCFRISPFGAPKIRAVKKEQKLYLWDWAHIDDAGIRFENFVASHLLKYCHFMEDTKGYKMELRFIRDIDGREIDFVVLQDKKPLFAVECKTGEKSTSSRHRYFKERTTIPKFYQVHLGKKDFVDASSGVRVLPFEKLCKELELP